MLKNGSQYTDGCAIKVIEQNLWIAHPEIGAAFDDFGGRIHFRAALDKGHLKPFLTVESFFQCGIIAGELELMQSAELQCYLALLLGRAGREARGNAKYSQKHDDDGGAQRLLKMAGMLHHVSCVLQSLLFDAEICPVLGDAAFDLLVFASVEEKNPIRQGRFP